MTAVSVTSISGDLQGNSGRGVTDARETVHVVASGQLRRQQVLSPGRRIRKCQRGLLDLPVRCSQAARVLAQVFLPGRDAEELDEAIRLVSVPVQSEARRMRRPSPGRDRR